MLRESCHLLFSEQHAPNRKRKAGPHPECEPQAKKHSSDDLFSLRDDAILVDLTETNFSVIVHGLFDSKLGHVPIQSDGSCFFHCIEMATGVKAPFLRSVAADAMSYDDLKILSHACSMSDESEEYADSDVIELMKSNPLPEPGDPNFDMVYLSVLEAYRHLIVQPSTHADMFSVASVANYFELVSISNIIFNTFEQKYNCIFIQTILIVQWGMCVDSIPTSSRTSISTRRTPATKSYHFVNMSSLFLKLQGNRMDHLPEKYVILFASGTGRSSHYDILRASNGNNQFKFTAADLPRNARKYWKIVKPADDNLRQVLSQFIEDEYLPEQRPPSPPDSPHWQSQETNIHLQHPFMKAMSVNFSDKLTLPSMKSERELMVWKSVFCEIFKNSNRTTFATHVKPSTVTTVSFSIESLYQCSPAPNTILQMHEGIRSIMKGIWICWEQLSQINKRKETGDKGCKSFQDDTEKYVVSEAIECVPEIRDTLMFFIRMIAHNISLRKKEVDVSVADVLVHCGFYANIMKSTHQIHMNRWIYGNAGNTPSQNNNSPQVSSITCDVAASLYRKAFTSLVQRIRDNRNSMDHPGKKMTEFVVAELIIALSVLSGMSNMNPQRGYDMRHSTTQWYQ